MAIRQGVQAEVLLSLALVMVTGTGLLAAVFLELNHARVETLHGFLGHGFVAQANDPSFEVRPGEVGIWWRIDAQGNVQGLDSTAESIDDGTRQLAREVEVLDQPLVQSGAPWTPIRFAAPKVPGPGIIAGRIDAPASGRVLLGLLVTDVAIFCLFGVTLLRRRVVGPLHRLAKGVREFSEGDLPAALPVEGVGEIKQLGTAFNEMQEALASRTGALEKAVVDLRTANVNLVQAREGLDRAERLAMVGSLAAGVAHEVGNPMGALLAFLDVASRDEGIGPDAKKCLEKASEQGERVRVILRQLLDFSRPPRVDHRPIDLASVARQVVELVAAQHSYSDIDFEIDAEDDVGLAMGDESLASQILLNLVINAASALEGAETRRIRLRIVRSCGKRRQADVDEAGTGGAPRSRTDSVVCWVEDSGPGVGAEEGGRIFDPFFTTKAPGEGTGLGLANARRLAEEMEGQVELDASRVELDASPDELAGARFLFRLKAAESDVAGSIETGAVRAVQRESRIP